MDLKYVLRYTFKNEITSIFSILSRVSLKLSTENNSVPIPVDWKHFDGNVQFMRLKLGEQGFATIIPTKNKFLKDKNGCREKPYNEIMLQKIMRGISDNCAKPCTFNYSSGWRLNKLCDCNQFVSCCKLCKDEKEYACAFNALFNVVQISEHEIKKPCLTLEYKGEVSKLSILPRSQIEYKLWFQHPAKVHVREEYLIYDTVNFISSIGGTVGFCIGLSFYTMTNVFLKGLRTGMSLVCPKDSGKENQRVK